MRKHLYLVTEHENDELEGTVQFSEMQHDRPTKNEEGPYTVFNKDSGEFRDVGLKVGMGYVDFEDEDDYQDRAFEAMKAKLGEIDCEWLDKAGVEL